MSQRTKRSKTARDDSAPHGRSLGKRSVGVVLALILLVSVAVVQLTSQSTSASSPTLRVDVPAVAVAGEPFQVSLWVGDAGSIAGYETKVLFDTDAATFRGVEHRNNELNRMGRDVQTIGPVEVPGGMAIGAYSCSFAHCVEIEGLAKQRRGGSGLVRLATFTIVPHQAGAFTFELGSPVFVDVDGAVMNVAVDQTAFTIQVEEGTTGE